MKDEYFNVNVSDPNLGYNQEFKKVDPEDVGEIVRMFAVYSNLNTITITKYYGD